MDFHALSRLGMSQDSLEHRAPMPSQSGPRTAARLHCRLGQLQSWVWTESTGKLPLAFPENTTSKGPHPNFQKASGLAPAPFLPRVSTLSQPYFYKCPCPSRLPPRRLWITPCHCSTSGGGPKDPGEKAIALTEPHLGSDLGLASQHLWTLCTFLNLVSMCLSDPLDGLIDE